MALKRDSESVKQSNESKDPTGPQVHKSAKSENVDSLVSRFLSELNDLSLEMEESKTSGDDATGERRNADYTFNARNKARSESNVDLEKISREIEDSLVQLEALRPAFAVPKEEPSQVAAPEPAPVTTPPPLEKSPIKDLPVVIPPEPKQKVGRPPELFRNSMAAARPPSRLPIAWIVGGGVVLAILGVAAFYYFGLNGNNRPALKEPAGTEIKMPAPALKEAESKVPAMTAGKPPEAAQSKKKGSTETAKSPSEEGAKSKSSVKNEQRNGEANTEKAKGTPAKPEAKPPVESARQESLPEKPKVSDEVPKSPPAQTVAVPAPPQQSVPAALPVAAQPQPKVQVAESGSGTPVPSKEAPPRETGSVAPKPTPPPAEAAAPPSPPVSRTVVQAEPVKKVSPIFPAIARARKVGGKVEVEAEINDNGDVFRAKAVSGPDILRSAAEDALMKWKFKPASVGGVNIPSKARIIVNFATQ